MEEPGAAPTCQPCDADCSRQYRDEAERVASSLVIQADDLQTSLSQVIVAMITSNVARAGHPSRVVIRRTTCQGRQSGLLTDSVVMTDNLATILELAIDRVKRSQHRQRLSGSGVRTAERVKALSTLIISAISALSAAQRFTVLFSAGMEQRIGWCDPFHATTIPSAAQAYQRIGRRDRSQSDRAAFLGAHVPKDWVVNAAQRARAAWSPIDGRRAF
jgi:mRNA-degrading endonuclease toxin of MazEF toxin-antitoxin module